MDIRGSFCRAGMEMAARELAGILTRFSAAAAPEFTAQRLLGTPGHLIE